MIGSVPHASGHLLVHTRLSHAIVGCVAFRVWYTFHSLCSGLDALFFLLRVDGHVVLQLAAVVIGLPIEVSSTAVGWAWGQ